MLGQCLRFPQTQPRTSVRLIATARRAAGLTQDQLAALSGINSANIRKYENGRALTGLQSLVRIAEALEVKPEALSEGLTSAQFAVPEHDGRRRPPAR
jgi:transcriptional regulator with XRE-family HTH domain